MKRKKLSKISILLIIYGIFCIVINKHSEFIYKREETNLVNEFFENTEESHAQDKYNMIIEIPTINLKKGIYDYSNSKNNVKYNIEIITEASPETENGNIVLAGHSGNGKNAYFQNLSKLNNEDEIFIYYNKKKYTYKIVNIYEIEKTGYADIIRDKSSNTLTLITCNQKDKTKQIVIVANYIKKDDLLIAFLNY